MSIFHTLRKFLFLFLLALTIAAPGSEDFEGSFADRNFNVHYVDSGGKHRVHSVLFPNFDALVDHPPQNIHFSIADISAHDNISTVARIRQDPVNPRNHAMWLRGTKPSDGKARNEMHFRYPYDEKSKPNGTIYTFALRFNVESWKGKGGITMQGYSTFPWLRVRLDDNGDVFLNLAQCKDGISPQFGQGCGGNGWDNYVFTNKLIGKVTWNTWNTLAITVLHSNNSAEGKIEMTLNGKKLVWIGRTTFSSSDTRIPFLKFGPYVGVGSIYYDDIHVIP